MSKISTLDPAIGITSGSATTMLQDADLAPAPPPPEGGWAASALELPNLSRGSVFASSARHAARLNAMAVTQTEYDALLRDRKNLVAKLLDGSITRSEENMLAYVRWSLDRYEDARHGHTLDALEAQVEAYENVIGEIDKFYAQLERRSVRKPRR